MDSYPVTFCFLSSSFMINASVGTIGTMPRACDAFGNHKKVLILIYFKIKEKISVIKMNV